MHRRWRPFWGSACCFCPCAAWYAGLMSRATLFTSACVAAHPRATVQAFSLGKRMDALREGEWPHQLFIVVAWLAIAVGVILGIVGLINEVRALATLQCGAEGLFFDYVCRPSSFHIERIWRHCGCCMIPTTKRKQKRSVPSSVMSTYCQSIKLRDVAINRLCCCRVLEGHTERPGGEGI